MASLAKSFKQGGLFFNRDAWACVFYLNRNVVNRLFIPGSRRWIRSRFQAVAAPASVNLIVFPTKLVNSRCSSKRSLMTLLKACAHHNPGVVTVLFPSWRQFFSYFFEQLFRSTGKKVRFCDRLQSGKPPVRYLPFAASFGCCEPLWQSLLAWLVSSPKAPC